MIKNIINKFFEFFGFKVIGNKKIVKHNDFDSIIKFILNNFENKGNFIFFDVGANSGQSISRFLKYNYNIYIHSFEPTLELYNTVKNKYSKQIKNKKIFINNFGLGDAKNELDFFSYKYNQINSFLPIEKNSKFEISRMIASKNKDSDFQKITKAKIDTLDEYCKNNKIDKIDLLKIDTQGFEPEVLKGSHNMLSEQKIKILEVELILGFAYEKNLDFFDIEKYLNPYGYKLISISNSGNSISYSNFQVDLIYVNKSTFENIRQLHKKNLEIKGVVKSVNEKHPYSY
jgi:FkbM family methyltransferase